MNVSGKILVVDDDETFLESTRDLLEAFGYEVHTARNGTEGLILARQIHPDVMILDVMMATATEGFEVARRVPETPELRNMVVLLVTGITRTLKLPLPPEPDETWLPVDRVLEKPVSPERLIAEVERAMRQRRTARKE